ncbi:GNAT family protein [Lachnospiraceae bacterium 29-84]
MDVTKLSDHYSVRKLSPADAGDIYRLCSKNKIFYQFHPPFATKESILEDMEALPPHKDYKDKYYVGFFKGHSLLAVLDLILDYPKEKTAYIGFFMMEAAFQGTGIGSGIIHECASYLQELGYQDIRLAIDKGNPQSEAFWTKNGFHKTGEEFPNETSSYLPMEKALPLTSQSSTGILSVR